MGLRDRLISALAPRQDAAPAPGGAPASRQDSLFNALTGLGGNFDKGSASRPIRQVALTDDELSCLYYFNGIARRIVDVLPERATRKGWTAPDLDGALDDLGAYEAVGEAMTWARLFGGSGLLVVTEDDRPTGYGGTDRDWLREPLDPERVGRILALHPLDAFDAWPHRFELDPRERSWRRPAEWSVSTEGFRGVVHASRIVHFCGNRRPPSDRIGGSFRFNRMPDDSALQAIWSEIRQLTDTMAGGAILAQELRESVLRVADLDAKQTGGAADAFAQRMSLLARTKSLLGLILLGPGDEYENRSNPPTGFRELSEEARVMLSAVTSIPQVVLFGEAPAGLNSDGASAWEGFRQTISGYQESHRPTIDQLHTLIYASQDGPTGGVVPDREERALEFHPLDEPTEKERAEVRKIVAEADAIYVQAGVVTPAEVTRARFSEDGWSFDLVAEEPDDEAALEAELEAARAALGAAVQAGAQPEGSEEPEEERDDAVSPTTAGVMVPVLDDLGPLRARAEAAIGQRLTVDDEPHVTVLYLGEVDEAALPEILGAVAEVAGSQPAERYTGQRVTAFPHGEKGTPIVVELDAWGLHAANDALLRRLAHLVAAPQFERYRAHVTLGYAAEPLDAAAMTALLELDPDLVVPTVVLEVWRGGEVVGTAAFGANA